MKALTLWQPWASLLACGAKKYETRSWATRYRGPIAIHAGKQEWHLTLWQGRREAQDALIRAFGGEPDHERGSAKGGNFNLSYGAIIATAELIDCIPTENFIQGGTHRMLSDQELLFGDWTPGRYAWEFTNMRILPEPIPVKGGQKIWNWESGQA